MEIWQIWCSIGLILLLLEMFTPALFFINLAIAAFFSAIFAYLGYSFLTQTIVFSILAILCISFLRPFMLQKIKNNGKKTGIEDKYIGHQAKVVHDVTATSGRIALYGEEWDARSVNDDLIPQGSFVKILKNESLIMYVESVKE